LIRQDLLPRCCRAAIAVGFVSLVACSGGSSSTPPPPPPPFVAVAATPFGTARMDLLWAANGVTPASFNVYRSTSAGTAGALVVSLPATTTAYRDSGLAANTTYFYTVESVVSGAAAVRSPQTSASTAQVPVFPQDVSGFSVTRVGSVVTLSWDPYPGATSFDIYRSGIQGLPVGAPGSITQLYGPLVVSGSFRTSFVDWEIAGSGHYSYEVVFLNSGATQSAKARAEIDIPVGALPGVDKPILDVWSSSKDSTSVHLFWWGSPGATAQHVYTGPTTTTITPLQGYPSNPLEGAQNFVAIQTVSPMYYQMDVSIFILPTGQSCFAVESEDGAARADSSAVCVNISAPPTTAGVTGVHTTVSNPTTITVAWDAPAGASNYRVYRLNSSTDPLSAAATWIGGVTGTSYVDSGLTPGTTYYYRVTAFPTGGGVESAPSDYALGKTLKALAPDVYPPLVLGAGQALLTWGGYNAGTTFKIYGGGASLPSAIDPNHLVLSTTLDPVTHESAWAHTVSAPTDAYAAFLLSAGIVVVWGGYWITEVYPDGTESPRSGFIPFVYL
jgi:fibronectin type 3 domain-containing protein